MTEQVKGPPDHVIEAFDGEPANLTKLPGGQGTSWRAGAVVLKPTEPNEQIAWLGAVLAQVSDSHDFRLARPVLAADGRWVVDGWSATAWLEGDHRRGQWENALRISGAFHAALARVRAVPPPPNDDGDPWSNAMRVAWGQEVAPSHHPGVNALLDKLSGLLQQAWEGTPAQIIHGDMGGNIVYADGLPPGIIDMSPHVAPAPFADAIIVADAIAWDSAPIALAGRFAAARPGGAQLLARAAVFRVVTMAQLDDQERVDVEVAAYQPVVDTALANT